MANSEAADCTILYGMMGAGKTTLGVMLANYLHQSFIDTDTVVEMHAGATCADIIADPNRDFGQVQSTAITAYRPDLPTVIATGGSVAMYPDLARHLGQFGSGIFVRVDPHVLEARLSPERIAALNNPHHLSFADLYRARMPSYESAADVTIDVGTEPAEETLAKLLSALGRTVLPLD